MIYTSTRDSSICISAQQAINLGISEDNGLFVPAKIPELDFRDLLVKIKAELPRSDRYCICASSIIPLFLDGFTTEYIEKSTEKAYTAPFSYEPAHITRIDDRLWALELTKGPTLAFKDIALQLMPYFFIQSKNMLGDTSHSLILVATSGDTGKAALEGYMDKENIDILVFYPRDGVSSMQQLQMCTQEGKNVYVVGVNGNFDDTQRAVKKLMTDRDLISLLAQKNIKFSSANSINIGRLIPQIVYYYSSYLELILNGSIDAGDEVNFAVPSGNFGNILAGYYAKKMGLPIKKLICASNSNDVLTEFIREGTYNAKREFFVTMSPSMDILVSSNVERLVWNVTGNNSNRTKEIYETFLEEGRFTLSQSELKELHEAFTSYSCSEAETIKSIKDIYNTYRYLLDPHTAVAFNVYGKYIEDTNDKTMTVVISTASPFKFASSVISAIEGEGSNEDSLRRLSEVTNTEIPKVLVGLEDKQVRFTENIDIGQEKQFLMNYLEKMKV